MYSHKKTAHIFFFSRNLGSEGKVDQYVPVKLPATSHVQQQ
jgi:hypothetical protein